MVSSLGAGQSELLVGMLNAIPPAELHALMAVAATAVVVSAIFVYRFSLKGASAREKHSLPLSGAEH